MPELPERYKEGGRLRLRLFGQMQVEIDGAAMAPLRSRRGLWLLALLTLRANRQIARSWLAGTLWPDSDDAQALDNLKRSLTDLRKALGPAAGSLQSPTKHTLYFALSAQEADVLAFDAAIQAGDAEALEQAASLYSAPVLEDCYELWVAEEQESRREAFLGVVEQLAALDATPYRIGLLRRAVRIEPSRENLTRLLMRALSANGDITAAAEAYRALRTVLLDEHGIAPASDITALYSGLHTRPKPDVPAPPVTTHSGAQAASYLPRSSTALIGRESALSAVGERLHSCALLTLAGPGGIGKTRLAIEAARQATPNYSDGAWFVDLAPLADSSDVARAAAACLGLREEQGRSLTDTLLAFLQPRILLLILDNCEHLLAACAEFVDMLLQRCPGLTILATSREPLRIPGEILWPVPPLEISAFQDDLLPRTREETAALAASSPALRLFCERARAARPAFALNESDLRSVIDICCRLDGIPLAIELAAARINALSVEQIAARLDDRFRLLTGGSRSALPRQRTLRALIDWSFDLLTAQEQTLLQRLTLFGGGCSLEAAEQVCSDDAPLENAPAGRGDGERKSESGTERIAPAEILDLLAALVDKSLLVAEPADTGEIRYRLLETLRQYAAEKLGNGAAYAQLTRRYHAYYLALVEEADPHMRDMQQNAWLNRLAAEHDNFRAAIALGRQNNEIAEANLNLCGLLFRFWTTRGHWSEGRRHLAEELSRPQSQGRTNARGRALMAAGLLARNQGDFETARVHFLECLEIRAALGDTVASAGVLNELGMIARNQGDYAAARALCEQCLALRLQQDNPPRMASILNNLGLVLQQQGAFAEAKLHFERALEINRRTGNRAWEAGNLSNLSAIAYHDRDFALARSLLYATLDIVEAMDIKNYRANVCYSLALLALATGELPEAQARLEQSIHATIELSDARTMAETLIGFARLKRLQGDPALAARLHGASLAHCERLHFVPDYPNCEIRREDLEQITECLGPETAFREDAAGRALTMEQALALARET